MYGVHVLHKSKNYAKSTMKIKSQVSDGVTKEIIWQLGHSLVILTSGISPKIKSLGQSASIKQELVL